MTENYWSKEQADSDLDPINSLLAELSDPEVAEEEFREDFFQGLAGRRQKAAFLLMTVWLTVIILNLVSWGIWLVFGFTSLAGIQILLYLLVKSDPVPNPLGQLTIAVLIILPQF